MKRIDIILALVIGEILAWFFYGIVKDLDLEIKVSFLNIILAVAFPILAVAGLWVAYLIGKRFIFVFQLAKFLLMGALATLIDLGILNVFMRFFGITEGGMYSGLVTASFVIATCIKYFGDKLWAFEKMGREQAGKEFSRFFIITLIGGGIHVLLASLIVNVVGSQFGLSPLMWGNIGKIGGILGGFAWNFLGYKFIVFKK